MSYVKSIDIAFHISYNFKRSQLDNHAKVLNPEYSPQTNIIGEFIIVQLADSSNKCHLPAIRSRPTSTRLLFSNSSRPFMISKIKAQM